MMKFNIQWQRLLPTPTNLSLRWSRNVFFILGILALSYVGYVLRDAQRYQAEQTQRFEQALKDTQRYQAEQAQRFEQALKDTNVTPTERLGLPVIEGASLGRIEINRVGLTAMVQEGVNEGTLRHAVGHIPSTPLPGQRGNVALAGHRDSFFRGLRNIHLDDEITLATLNGTYRYRVETTKVVAPEETEVLADAGYDRLTLVTCYPFNFVGSAPKRFIVSARKIPE